MTKQFMKTAKAWKAKEAKWSELQQAAQALKPPKRIGTLDESSGSVEAGSYDEIYASLALGHLTIDDVRELYASLEVAKHYGPGPHDNGTEQSVHGGARAVRRSPGTAVRRSPVRPREVAIRELTLTEEDYEEARSLGEGVHKLSSGRTVVVTDEGQIAAINLKAPRLDGVMPKTIDGVEQDLYISTRLYGTAHGLTMATGNTYMQNEVIAMWMNEHGTGALTPVPTLSYVEGDVAGTFFYYDQDGGLASMFVEEARIAELQSDFLNHSLPGTYMLWEGIDDMADYEAKLDSYKQYLSQTARGNAEYAVHTLLRNADGAQLHLPSDYAAAIVHSIAGDDIHALYEVAKSTSDDTLWEASESWVRDNQVALGVYMDSSEGEWLNNPDFGPTGVFNDDYEMPALKGQFSPEQAKLIEAKITEAVGPLGLEPRAVVSGAEVSFSVIDTATGALAGSFAFKLTEGGDNLYLGYASLNTDWQGQGVATALYTSLVPMVADLGIPKLTMNANITNGAYSWPRLGFIPSSEYDFRKIKDHVDIEAGSGQWDEFFDDNPVFKRAVDRFLSSDDPKSLWKFVDTKTIGPSGQYKAAAEIMYGASFDASLDLTDREQAKRLYDALSMKFERDSSGRYVPTGD